MLVKDFFKCTSPILMTLIFLLPKTGSAQDSLKTMKLNDLISSCLVELEREGSPEPFAGELLGRSGFALGEVNRARGAQCLTEVYGNKYEFKNGRFISPEAIREKENMLAAVALEKAANEAEYQEALISVCNDEFQKNKFRALTTPSCAQVFKERGLPDAR
jgi:hypothetical protein